MIRSDVRLEEIRRWAEAEVIRLAGRGPLDEEGILAATLRSIPWGTEDPWAQETVAATARRTATATLARLRQTRSCPQRRPASGGLALLGDLALWVVACALTVAGVP